MADIREVKEGLQYQGKDEQIAYILTTTPWGSSPAAVAVTAWDITTTTWTDVSATVLSGAASVNGDDITTPLVTALTADHDYRIEVKFTCSGNIFEPYFRIRAQA